MKKLSHVLDTCAVLCNLKIIDGLHKKSLFWIKKFKVLSSMFHI